jgi:hypothetical protein
MRLPRTMLGVRVWRETDALSCSVLMFRTARGVRGPLSSGLRHLLPQGEDFDWHSRLHRFSLVMGEEPART